MGYTRLVLAIGALQGFGGERFFARNVGSVARM
jgi:hypothetical protein